MLGQMREWMERTWVLALVCTFAAIAGLVGKPGPAAAEEAYSVAAVALEGDPAPGTGGGSYSLSIQGAEINDSGDVLFYTFALGGPLGFIGIFLEVDGTDTDVALTGEPAPGTGSTYGNIGPPGVNASGDVAFGALAGARRGMFLASGGVDSAVVLDGDTAPGTGGGTYASAGDPSINDAGDIAFSGSIAGGSSSDGIFRSSGGVLSAVALVGDPAPGTGGGTYTSSIVPPFDPRINAAGDIVFVAWVTGDRRGIFIDRGTQSVAALDGDTAPGTGGGTYGTPFLGGLNASGQVVFRAAIDAGTASAGVFVDTNGTDAAVVLAGQTAPGTGGATYASFGGSDINDAGDVVFSATLTGGSAATGVFVVEGTVVTPIALEGDAAPLAGGTFSSLGLPTINNEGEIAFVADVSGGSAGFGVFKAIPPKQMPALSGTAIALLAASLLAAGRLYTTRGVERTRRAPPRAQSRGRAFP